MPEHRPRSNKATIPPLGPGEGGAVTDLPPITWRSIEALRGIAALLVMALHALLLAPSVYGSSALLDRWVLNVFVWGWVGVPVFFVLSGFVLSLPWFGPDAAPPPLRGYLARRAARILPAFWLQWLLVLLGLALLGGFPGVPAQAEASRWPVQLALAFYLERSDLPWLGVWWTLPVELAFYLLLPLLLAPRLRRARWPLLGALTAGAILLRGVAGAGLLSPALAHALAHHLPTRIDAFLVGVAAAALWQQRNDLFSGGRVLLLVPAGLVGIAACIAAVRLPMLPMPDLLPRSPWLSAWPTLFAVAVALLLLGLVALERQGRLTRLVQPLVPLGTLSYGVYLWHLPVLQAVVGLSPGGGPSWWAPALLLAALPPTLLLAFASWRWVEQPARRWARRRFA